MAVRLRLPPPSSGSLNGSGGGRALLQKLATKCDLAASTCMKVKSTLVDGKSPEDQTKLDQETVKSTPTQHVIFSEDDRLISG